MRVVRALSLILLAVLGLALGGLLLLATGLLAVTPPGLAAAGPAQPWDITLTVSDTFLTTWLNQSGAQGSPTAGSKQPQLPLQLKDVKATFQADGTVLITGAASPAGGAPVPPGRGGGGAQAGGIAVELVLRPTVAEGKLKTEIVKAQFGPLQVPQRVADFLDGPLNTQLDGALAGKPYQLLDIRVTQGLLTVHARRQ